MEEILASIRKIIAEEKAAPRSDSAQAQEPTAAPQMAESAPGPAPPPPDPGPGMPAPAEAGQRPSDNGATPPVADDVLELTEIVGEDGSVATIESVSAPSEAPSDAPIREVTPDAAVAAPRDAPDDGQAAPVQQPPPSSGSAEPAAPEAAPAIPEPEPATPQPVTPQPVTHAPPTADSAVQTIPEPQPQAAPQAEADATAQQVESILFGDAAPAPEPSPAPEPERAPEPAPTPVEQAPAQAQEPPPAAPSGPTPSAALSELAGGEAPADTAAGEPNVANLPATQQDLSKDLQRLFEAMSPVFRQWLDKNLPTLIEEVVERVAEKKGRTESDE